MDDNADKAKDGNGDDDGGKANDNGGGSDVPEVSGRISSIFVTLLFLFVCIFNRSDLEGAIHELLHAF